MNSKNTLLIFGSLHGITLMSFIHRKDYLIAGLLMFPLILMFILTNLTDEE